MPVTELGYMIANSGLQVMDEDTREGQILSKAWHEVTSQPTGPYRAYFGLEVENPSNLWAWFDFASVEDHQTFAKKFGGEAVKDLPKILDPGFMKHVDFQPFPPSALKAPVTEVMFAFFPSDISAEGRAAANTRMEKFNEQGLSKCADVQAFNYGWGVENDFPVRGGVEGQTGAALVALIGWPSIDAHMKFRDTDTFKESVGLLRGLEGMIKLGMFHVKTRVFENEARRE